MSENKASNVLAPLAMIAYQKNGNIFHSNMAVLVNTINCVGAPRAAGLAGKFQDAYPEMYVDYLERCRRGEVIIGEPYLYRVSETLEILNFPTKQHYREASKLCDIEQGLQYLLAHAEEWSVKSIAFPALGCGLGRLKWKDVYPVMMTYLKQLNIPVEIHSSFDMPTRKQKEISSFFQQSGAVEPNGVGEPAAKKQKVIDLTTRI